MGDNRRQQKAQAKQYPGVDSSDDDVEYINNNNNSQPNLSKKTKETDAEHGGLTLVDDLA